ncbi:hypothetical protein Nepgr_031066 [Nepenthes gracilis]|uniref:Uncharacterized protein n=1 Tax=Nepenthes gracilis TaxID=150966 RepID=A0AAD3TFW0_NEPGR|nr:hypothetical protein Nepgr_031066 [Nepenthes gracilis]
MAQALLIADPKAVELVKNVNLSGSGNVNKTVPKHCIQVSNTKKPFFFYLKLAKVGLLFTPFVFLVFSPLIWQFLCDVSGSFESGLRMRIL